MKSIILFLLLVAGFSAQAQDLTGIWRGSFRQGGTATSNRMMDLLGATEKYKFEVQLDQRDKRFSGVTYSYLTTVFYGKATCEGAVNPTTRKVKLDELKIVEVRMSGGSDACIMTLMMQYSRVDDEEFLEGTYTSMNIRDSTNCGRGTVFLRKVITSDFYKEPFLVQREEEKEKAARKKPDTAATKITPKVATTAPVKKPPVIAKTNTPPASNKAATPKTNSTSKPAIKKPVVKPPVKETVKQPPVASNPAVKIVPADTAKKIEIKTAPAVVTPKVLASRENELVKTITADASEIVVNIYDNGAIDNDTISVYLDKKLVLSKKRLTEKALTLKFTLDSSTDYHELIMVAENLGEIPPNTSLMVVNAGNKQYEVRITSTEQKNAVVIFKLNR